MDEIKALLIGINAILEGLEYHYNNYLKLNASLTTNEELKENQPEIFSTSNLPIIAQMKHEAVAYLNRMGQFYYFATSDIVKEKIKNPKEVMPRIVYLIPFRKKYSAHRAIDKPLKNDDLSHMYQLDIFFSVATMASNHNILFQIFLDNNEARQFNLLKQHHEVMSEAKAIIAML